MRIESFWSGTTDDIGIMMSLGLFAITKILVSILFVVVLSVIAEKVGPRVAGIISGYPLGVALSLFFIGLEVSPSFAARSAVSTVSGLAAIVALVCGYLLGLRWAGDSGRWKALAITVPTALAAYFLAAWILSLIPVHWFSAVAVALLSIVLSGSGFRTIADVRIIQNVRLGFIALLLRAVFAALAILAITTAARVVSPKWAGLFSAFPSTMLPLLIIIQYAHQPAHVRTIIKNVPHGLQSMFIYTVLVALTYDTLGIAWGTGLGYLAATTYLLVRAAVENAGKVTQKTDEGEKMS